MNSDDLNKYPGTLKFHTVGPNQVKYKFYTLEGPEPSSEGIDRYTVTGPDGASFQYYAWTRDRGEGVVARLRALLQDTQSQPYISQVIKQQQTNKMSKFKYSSEESMGSWVVTTNPMIAKGLSKMADEAGIEVAPFHDYEKGDDTVAYDAEEGQIMFVDSSHVGDKQYYLGKKSKFSGFYGCSVDEAIDFIHRYNSNVEDIEADDDTITPGTQVELELSEDGSGNKCIYGIVYSSGVRLEESTGYKISWISADDLKSLHDIVQQMQDQVTDEDYQD